MAKLRNWKNFLAAPLLIAIAAGLTLTELGAQSEDARHVFVGVVSDSTCGVKHKTDNARECTEACVNAGANYVLVIGDAVHPLQGDAEEFKKFAGEQAEVSASLDGNTLKVARIGPVSQPS